MLLPFPDLQTSSVGPSWVMPPHHRSLVPSEWCKQAVVAEIIDDNLNHELNYVIEHKDNLLCQLPSDVIPLISKHLHLFDYLNFRASCKTMHSAVPDLVEWRANNSLPLFMFSKNGNALCELRDLCRNDSHSVVIPHSPAVPTGIEFSKDGWLVVCTGEEKPFLFFNPFIKVKGRFPPYEFMHEFASIGFSTCPTSPDCVSVGIHNVCTWFCTLRFGDEKWRVHEFDRQVHEFDNGDDVEFRFQPSQCSPVYYKEAFYFLDKFGYLGVFTLVTRKEATWKIYDRPQRLTYTHSRHLVECDGELVAVFIGEVGKWVQLFRFNHSNKSWVKLENLGNHTLFIGHKSSFSVIPKEGHMKNNIYLPLRKGNDNVFYSMETRKYHAVGSEDQMDNLYGLKGQSLCCWI